MNIRTSSFFAVVGIVAGVFVYTACSDDNAVTEPVGGTSTSSSSGNSASGSSSGNIDPPLDAGFQEDGAAKDCFDNPSTHFELINGCTDAVRIERNPVLKQQYPDGGLPPI